MDRVPQEIQKIILNLCDDKTRRTARITCKEWFNYIDYRNFVIYLTKKSEWSQIVDRFCSHTKPISLHLRKNIINNMKDINEQLLRLTNLTDLTFDDLEKDEEVNKTEEWLKLTALPNLYSVKIFNGNYQIPDEALISFKHLTRIDVKRQEKDDNAIIRTIRQLTNLQRCSICLENALEANIFEKFNSRLTYLSIYVQTATNNIVEELFQNCSDIKELDFAIRGQVSGDISLKALTKLETIVFSGGQIHELNSTNLTLLELFKVKEEYIARAANKLANLEELVFDLERPEDYDSDNDEIEGNNNEVEDELTVDGRSVIDWINQPRTFSYEWLSSLTSLQYLNIDPMEGDGLTFVPSQIERLQISVFKPLNLSHVSRFGSLKELYLVTNKKKLHNLSAISQLTGLKCLQIQLQRGRERLNFPLSVLTNLEWLYLERVSGDISNLPNLGHLRLTASVVNEFTGVGLPNLTQLDFENDWSGEEQELHYTCVSSLTTLKSLALQLHNYPYDCSYFSTLTALENLTINCIGSEQDYCYLSPLTRLTNLSVWYGLPTEKLLQLPTSLQRLNVGLAHPGGLFASEEIKKQNEGVDVTSITDQLIARLPNLYKYSFD